MDAERSLQLRVGVFVLGALAVLVGFFFVVGNPVLGAGIPLRLDYAFTGPIKEGASVRISGVTVGAVKRVEFMGDRPADAAATHPIVRLHVFVEQRARPLLTQGTRFHVTTLGVLGEHYVDVVPGPAGATPLTDNEVVRGVDMPRTDLLMSRMADLLDQVGRVLDGNDRQLAQLVGAATRLMERLDVVLADKDLGVFLADVQATLADARGVLDGARRILKDPEMINGMLSDGRQAVADGRLMMVDVQTLLDSLKTEVPPALQRSNTMLAQAEQLTVRVDGLLRALEKAGLTDDKRLAGLVARGESVMERADRLSARADVLLARIEKGEGSVGKLMKDDQVYEDLKALLAELRANPWKLMIPGK